MHIERFEIKRWTISNHVENYFPFQMASQTILNSFKTERSKHSFDVFIASDAEAKALINRICEDFLAYRNTDKNLTEKYPEKFMTIIAHRHQYLFEQLGFTFNDLDAAKKIIAKNLNEAEYVELAADIALSPLATAFIANVTASTIEQTVAELPKFFQKKI